MEDVWGQKGDALKVEAFSLNSSKPSLEPLNSNLSIMKRKPWKTLICAACSASNRCKPSVKYCISKLISPFPITYNSLRLSSTNQKNQEKSLNASCPYSLGIMRSRFFSDSEVFPSGGLNPLGDVESGMDMAVKRALTDRAITLDTNALRASSTQKGFF